MQLTQFIQDEDAVSPVIGVILMVAITVILAAVIGTFVLGLGDQVSETSPQASFSFDYDGVDTLTVTHESGEAIDGARLKAVGSGVSVDNGDTVFTTLEMTAGTSVDLNLDASLDGGDTVRIVWTSESGSTSATLQTYTYNG